MAEGTPENDEFLQVALAAHESVKQQEAAETPAAPPTESAATEQPKAGDSTVTAADGQLKESESVTDKPREQSAEPKKPDWRAIAAAEREKRLAQANQKRLPTLEAENSGLRAELQRYKELEALKESNPLEAAEKFGLNYDRLTQEYIRSIEKNPNQPPPQLKSIEQVNQKLVERLDRLEKELAGERSQKALSNHHSSIKNLVDSRADEFELTKAYGDEGTELVRQIVQRHWVETATLDAKGNIISPGEIMPDEEAAKLAEQYYENERLKKLVSTKKLQAMLKKEPEKKAEPAAENKAAAPQAAQPKTAPSTTQTLSQMLRQGGAQQTNFSGEWDELAALAKKLESQIGN